MLKTGITTAISAVILTVEQDQSDEIKRHSKVLYDAIAEASGGIPSYHLVVESFAKWVNSPLLTELEKSICIRLKQGVVDLATHTATSTTAEHGEIVQNIWDYWTKWQSFPEFLAFNFVLECLRCFDVVKPMMEAVNEVLEGWYGNQTENKKEKKQIVMMLHDLSQMLVDAVERNGGVLSAIDSFLIGDYVPTRFYDPTNIHFQIAVEVSQYFPNDKIEIAVSNHFGKWRCQSYSSSTSPILKSIIDDLQAEVIRLALAEGTSAAKIPSTSKVQKSQHADFNARLGRRLTSIKSPKIDLSEMESTPPSSNSKNSIPLKGTKEEEKEGKPREKRKEERKGKKKEREPIVGGRSASRIHAEIAPELKAKLGPNAEMSLGKIDDQIQDLNKHFGGTAWQCKILNPLSYVTIPHAFDGDELQAIYLSKLILKHLATKSETDEGIMFWSQEYGLKVMGLSGNSVDKKIYSDAIDGLWKNGWIAIGSQCSTKVLDWGKDKNRARPVIPSKKALSSPLITKGIVNYVNVRNRWRDSVQKLHQNLQFPQIRLELKNLTERLPKPDRSVLESASKSLPSHHKVIQALSATKRLFEILDDDAHFHVKTKGEFRRIFGPAQQMPKSIRTLLNLTEVDIGSCHPEMAAKLALDDSEYDLWCAEKVKCGGKAYSLLMKHLGLSKEDAKSLLTLYIYDHDGYTISKPGMKEVHQYFKECFPSLHNWIMAIHRKTVAAKRRNNTNESCMSQALEPVEQRIIVGAIAALDKADILAINLHDGILTLDEHKQIVWQAIMDSCHVNGVEVVVAAK